MKNKDANNRPWLMFLFAVIFIGGGLAGFITILNSKSKDRVMFLVITSILIVLGCVIFVYAILRTIKLKRAKTMLNDSSVFVTDATFVKAKFSSFSSSSVGIGNVTVPTHINVYKKVFYQYIDENGVTRTGKSTKSYVPSQVEYLKNLHTFKIKCKGSKSEIIEEIPEINSRINIS